LGFCKFGALPFLSSRTQGKIAEPCCSEIGEDEQRAMKADLSFEPKEWGLPDKIILRAVYKKDKERAQGPMILKNKC